MAIGGILSTGATEYLPKYEIIDPQGVFYNEDLAVATYNVLDYGVDNTGEEDCTSVVQEILDAAGGVGKGFGNDRNKRGDYSNPSGGVVYFPAGTYLFNKKLVIPRGVTIRGDWQAPDGKSAIKGTVFAIAPSKSQGKGTVATAYGFITMQPSTLVSNIAFWYPEQNPYEIIKYPATIVYGQSGYWGNDYCNVRHCTFVNSYIGIQFHPGNGGGCPNIFDIYGTPLYEGFEMDCIADVGRFDGIHYSAKYWENSGLGNAPVAGEIDEWLYENATGVVMRRNDWSYTCNLEVEGYASGFHSQESSPNANTKGQPNGHCYGFNLKNCKVGVEVSSTSNAGIMFANVKTPGCGYGVWLHSGGKGPVQFYDCELSGRASAIVSDDSAGSAMMLQDCNVNTETNFYGGHFQSVNSTFRGDVNIMPKARTLFVGNTLSNGARFNNNSLFKCVVSEDKADYPKLPEFKDEWMAIKTHKPSKAQLFVVTDPEFGVIPVQNPADLAGASDCSVGIKKALDMAASQGGGIVYLPVGHYRCNSEIVIPEGVELKGAGDIATVPKRNGAILEVYCGEGNENGTPFITMSKNSGLRGVTIDYPSQNDPYNVKKFPYSVKGDAGVYIVNLALRASYRGVDLFSNKCDNHYVDYLAGHAFMNVIHVGGGSENGVINNIQCNTIVYACGDETKFGAWPNSMACADYSIQQAAYCQNERDLDFFIVGDTKNQILYNNFLFGCNIGMHFVSDGNGGAYDCHALGNAVDGAVNTFVLEAAASDVNFINSQIVALDHDPKLENGQYKHNPDISSYIAACFIKTGKDFNKTVTFFSSDNWGGGDYMIQAEGGNVVMAMANMAASGSSYTAHAAEGASVRVFNSTFNSINQLVGKTNSDEARFSFSSSVMKAPSSAVVGRMKEWKDIMDPAWVFVNKDVLESRTGWKATASHNNGNAQRGIDGNDDTRWDTGSAQSGLNGKAWYQVDFNKNLTFNSIILDSSGSSGDGPGGYTVEAYTDGAWRQVAEGSNGSAVTMISFDETVTASMVKVNLVNSTKSGYWSIHEFYVANLESAEVEEIAVASDVEISYHAGSLYLPESMIGNNVDVFNMSGAKVYSAAVQDCVLSLESLPRGIYVVKIGNHAIKVKL